MTQTLPGAAIQHRGLWLSGWRLALPVVLAGTVVGMMWGFFLLWLFYPRYDHAGAQGKIGSMAA